MKIILTSDYHRYNSMAQPWGGVFISFPLGSEDSSVYKQYNSENFV